MNFNWAVIQRQKVFMGLSIQRESLMLELLNKEPITKNPVALLV